MDQRENGGRSEKRLQDRSISTSAGMRAQHAEEAYSSKSVDIIHKTIFITASIERFHGIIIENLKKNGIKKSPKASCKGSEEASDSDGARTWSWYFVL